MTLPSSGSISFYDINIELGRSGTATLDIESAASDTTIQNCATPYPDPSNPESITEWYGYNHSLNATLQSTVITSNTDCNYACTYSSCAFSGVDLWKYTPSGKYYWYSPAGQYCKTATGFFSYSAVCSGGSRVGQPCYTFNGDRTLASTTTCTTTTTTTTTTAACQCISNSCDVACGSYYGCFCYSVSDCQSPSSCL